MWECLNISGKILSATISRIADKWFVSIPLKMKITPGVCENQEAVGVDLGVKKLATISDLNAAINLKNFAVGSTVKACGDAVRPK